MVELNILKVWGGPSPHQTHQPLRAALTSRICKPTAARAGESDKTATQVPQMHFSILVCLILHRSLYTIRCTSEDMIFITISYDVSSQARWLYHFSLSIGSFVQDFGSWQLPGCFLAGSNCLSNWMKFEQHVLCNDSLSVCGDPVGAALAIMRHSQARICGGIPLDFAGSVEPWARDSR